MRRRGVAILVLALVVCLAASPTWADKSASTAPGVSVGEPAFMPDTPVLERPWSTDSEKFNFIILGDRTGGTPAQWPGTDRAIEEINELRPDFVVMVGDMIYGYIQSAPDLGVQWKEVWEHYDKLQVPFIYLPGNHDIFSKASYDYWVEHNGRTYYSFDYKGCHFLMLNTEETWKDGIAEEGQDLGVAQVAFALDDLAKHKDAKYTFIFMHKPLWVTTQDANTGQRYSSPQWNQIDAALGDRPYTVFAGHYHRTIYEEREGHRYIVLSTTRGERVPEENRAPEMGGFSHYTNVTVDDHSAYLSLIEPGHIWPADIAPLETQQAVRGLLKLQANMPEGFGSDKVSPSFDVTIDNKLPDPVTLKVEFDGLKKKGWHRTGSTPDTIEVASGNTKTLTYTFEAKTKYLVPVPRVKAVVEYHGHQLIRADRNITLFPDSALRAAPVWMVAAPFPAGKLSPEMPQNPREVMPQLYTPLGPEKGYEKGATFQSDDTTVGWHEVKTEAAYGLGFLNVGQNFPAPFNVLGYAACSVYSPSAQTVLAKFRVDDYGMIFINGKMVDPGLIRTRQDPTWVALPLEKGWNQVVVKNVAISGGWNFWLGFVDPNDELKFAVEPPTK